MLHDPDLTVEDMAKRLGVAPSTLYRYLHGGRSVVRMSGVEESFPIVLELYIITIFEPIKAQVYGLGKDG